MFVGAIFAEETRTPNQEVRSAVARLESDDYETRDAATRLLILSGKPAIPTLESEIPAGSPETRIRGLTILEQMLVKGDVETALAAQEALERLQLNGSSMLYDRVETIFSNHRELIESTILKYFESLGGRIQREGAPALFNRGMFARGFEIPQLTLILGADFKGTQTDLLRLRNVGVVQILHRKSVRIEDETRRLLLESNPGLKFITRDLYLGIKFHENGDAILITDVTPNSAASDAGIRADDEILTIDGLKLDSKEFVSYLQEKNAGDEVKLQLKREEKPIEIVVKLREL